MGTELTLSVPFHIMASVLSALFSLCSAEPAWQYHLPPVHTEHPSTQSSAVHYLCKEETEHYTMLNYKMSLSILCKGGEAIQIAKEINPRKIIEGTILNLLNLTFFFFLSSQKFQKFPGKCNGPDCICSTQITSFLKTLQYSPECSCGFTGRSYHWLIKKSLNDLYLVLWCFAKVCFVREEGQEQSCLPDCSLLAEGCESMFANLQCAERRYLLNWNKRLSCQGLGFFFQDLCTKLDHSLGLNLKIVFDAVNFGGLVAAEQFVFLGWLCTSSKPKLSLISWSSCAPRIGCNGKIAQRNACSSGTRIPSGSSSTIQPYFGGIVLTKLR